MELLVQAGPDAGKVFQVGSAPLVAGRQSGTDILLNDNQVSRRHLSIQEVNGTLVVTDLGSANGTTVNGQGLPANQPRTLAPGDVVKVGETVMVVRPAASVIPPTANPATSVQSPNAFAQQPPVYNQPNPPAYLPQTPEYNQSPAYNQAPPVAPAYNQPAAYNQAPPVQPQGYNQPPTPAYNQPPAQNYPGYQPTPTYNPATPATPAKKGRGGLIAGIGAIVVLAVAAIVGIVVIGGNSNNSNATATSAAVVNGDTLPTRSPVPTAVPVVGLSGSAALPPAPPVAALPTPTPVPTAAPSGNTNGNSDNGTVSGLGLTVTFPKDWDSTVVEDNDQIEGDAPDGVTYALILRLSGIKGQPVDRLTKYVNALDEKVGDLKILRAAKAAGSSGKTADAYITFTDKDDVLRRDYLVAVVGPSDDTYYLVFSTDDQKFDSQTATFNNILSSIQLGG